jgi:hypothetical protein
VAATQLQRLVYRWVNELDVLAAFVSSDEHDIDAYTYYERNLIGKKPSSWHVDFVRLRGIFWTTFLGEHLCALLGGSDVVVQNAPVAISERIRKGVWLQTSQLASCGRECHRELETFLAPVIVAASNPAYAETPRIDRSGSDIHQVPIRHDYVPVTIESVGYVTSDITLSVNIDKSFPQSRWIEVIDTVSKWYDSGFSKTHGESGFHELSPPFVDESASVIRWEVDLGQVDARMAIDSLVLSLGSLSGSPVSKVVIGHAIED